MRLWSQIAYLQGNNRIFNYGTEVANGPRLLTFLQFAFKRVSIRRAQYMSAPDAARLH